MNGKRMSIARKKAGFSQREIAQQLGFTPETISLWERGIREPAATTLCKIADLLNVTTDFLLDRTEYPNVYECREILPDGRTAFIANENSLSFRQAVEIIDSSEQALKEYIQQVVQSALLEDKRTARRGKPAQDTILSRHEQPPQT